MGWRVGRAGLARWWLWPAEGEMDGRDKRGRRRVGPLASRPLSRPRPPPYPALCFAHTTLKQNATPAVHSKTALCLTFRPAVPVHTVSHLLRLARPPAPYGPHCAAPACDNGRRRKIARVGQRKTCTVALAASIQSRSGSGQVRTVHHRLCGWQCVSQRGAVGSRGQDKLRPCEPRGQTLPSTLLPCVSFCPSLRPV